MKTDFKSRVVWRRFKLVVLAIIAIVVVYIVMYFLFNRMLWPTYITKGHESRDFYQNLIKKYIYEHEMIDRNKTDLWAIAEMNSIGMTGLYGEGAEYIDKDNIKKTSDGLESYMLFAYWFNSTFAMLISFFFIGLVKVRSIDAMFAEMEPMEKMKILGSLQADKDIFSVFMEYVSVCPHDNQGNTIIPKEIIKKWKNEIIGEKVEKKK